MNRLIELLDEGWDHTFTVENKKPVDKNKLPIPWFTYPSISYLKNLSLSNLRIFEWGSGYSTLFFEKSCKEITSVDNNRIWHDKTKSMSNGKAQLVLCEDIEDYPEVIKDLGYFDIIIIDGIERKKCALNALQQINKESLIILDNSDWYWGANLVLRKSKLLEIPFTGFGPINNYAWTTSFFFGEKFNFFDKSKNCSFAEAGLEIEPVLE